MMPTDPAPQPYKHHHQATESPAYVNALHTQHRHSPPHTCMSSSSTSSRGMMATGTAPVMPYIPSHSRQDLHAFIHALQTQQRLSLAYLQEILPHVFHSGDANRHNTAALHTTFHQLSQSPTYVNAVQTQHRHSPHHTCMSSTSTSSRLMMPAGTAPVMPYTPSQL
jgi:hypothetical protein